jgi:hypothetical protein
MIKMFATDHASKDQDNEARSRQKTCEAHTGTFMVTSNTVAPQAIAADFRGSDRGTLFPSLDSACTS